MAGNTIKMKDLPSSESSRVTDLIGLDTQGQSVKLPNKQNELETEVANLGSKVGELSNKIGVPTQVNKDLTVGNNYLTDDLSLTKGVTYKAVLKLSKPATSDTPSSFSFYYNGSPLKMMSIFKGKDLFELEYEADNDYTGVRIRVYAQEVLSVSLTMTSSDSLFNEVSEIQTQLPIIAESAKTALVQSTSNLVTWEQGSINGVGRYVDDAKSARSISFIGNNTYYAPQGYVFAYAVYFNKENFVRRDAVNSNIFTPTSTDNRIVLILSKENSTDIDLSEINNGYISWLLKESRLIEEDLTSKMEIGRYDTSSATLPTELNPDGSFRNIKIDVSAGDVLFVSCQGGVSPRAYAIYNQQGVQTRVAAASYTFGGIIEISENETTAIIQSTASFSYKVAIKRKLSNGTSGDIEEKIRSIEAELVVRTDVSAEIAKNANHIYRTYPNATIPAIEASNGYGCVRIDDFQRVRVKGTGAGNALLWAIYDNQGNKVEESERSVTEDRIIEAKSGQKTILINVNLSQPYLIETYSGIKDNINKTNANVSELQKEVEEIKDEIVGNIVSFDVHDKTLVEITNELQGVDFWSVGADGNYHWFEEMQQKWDALVLQYPNFITKYDSASEAGLSYPTYCNLNGTETEKYVATPSYTIPMFKISSNYGNAMWKNGRKKVLIVGGVHGWELASQFNTFVFANHLCKASSATHYLMFGAIDFYIIPTLNGYGAYHNGPVGTKYPYGGRCNANNVNINRNFPFADWEESGAGTNNWTGPSAGSEFETQLVIKLIDKIKPDFVIDHHGYGSDTNTIVYGEVTTGYKSWCQYHNSALEYCGVAQMNYPNYFGLKFNTASNIATVDKGEGKLGDYPYFMKGICSVTIEVPFFINRVDGVYTATVAQQKLTRLQNTDEGKKVARLNEYLLRQLIARFYNYIL